MTNKIGKKRKITFWTRLGFGMGGMLNSGALTFTHSYMVLFLSTECGLSAGEAALISSFAIYVNAILCPLMGFVADNFYATKIGRIFGRRRFSAGKGAMLDSHEIGERLSDFPTYSLNHETKKPRREHSRRGR